MRVVYESLHGRFSNAAAAIKRYKLFENTIKDYPVIDIEDVEKEGIDLIIEGSDTVWDVESEYFMASPKEYWPIVDGVDICTYAASLNNSTADEIKKIERAIKCLDGIKNITVRDEYTKSVISQLTSKEINVVCDPTILVKLEAFDKFKKEIEEKPYILVYIFNDVTEDVYKPIREYADKNGLQIISVGKNYSWIDKQVTLSVENFVTYFANASFVLTNTFHGNVFSIINNKNFICAPCKNKKVHELHKLFGVTERRVVEDSDINKLLTEKIDYEVVNNIIEDIRSNSKELLREMVG